MKPTDEQVKEFWERCDVPTYVRLIDGKWVNILPIDLNNLFKYAVPRLEDWNMGKCENGDVWVTVHNGRELFEVKDKDPALALFWALREVRGG